MPQEGAAALEENTIFDELVDIIGAEAAGRLAKHYSGSNLYIPRSIEIKEIHRKIKEEFRSGAAYRELAMRYGYTEQHIRNITKLK